LLSTCVVLTRPIAFIGVLGMLIAAGITVADVLMRWLASTAITALNEITAMVFAVAVSACIPAGLAGGVNLKVDILARWLTARAAAWLDALGGVLLLLFFLVLTWRIAVFAGSLAEQGRTTLILGWPMAPFMSAVAVLLGIGTLVQVVVAVDAARRALMHEPTQVGPTRLAHDNGEQAEGSPLVTAIVLAATIAAFALVIYGLIEFTWLSRWATQHVGLAVTIAFAVMWIFMLAQVPLAAVMGLTGIFGAALFTGFTPAVSAFATEATSFLTNSQVATLPLFLMMGSFAAVSGMADDMYRLGHVLLSRYRGGLALATIGGCAGFGALTGSSLATAATIGRVAIPEMRARGYSPALATGCCAAGGTLGPIVPPGSGPIIVYALLTEASIGQLFVASVGPAVLTILFYFLTVMIYVRVAPDSAPRTREREPGELAETARRCIPVGILVFAVMGGLYFGIFTDTESAAVGAVGAFLFAAWRGQLGDHCHHGDDLWLDLRRADLFVLRRREHAHADRDLLRHGSRLAAACGDGADPGGLSPARLADGGIRRHGDHRADRDAAGAEPGLRSGLVGHHHADRGRGRHDPSAARAQRIRAQEHPAGRAARHHLQGRHPVLRHGSAQAHFDGAVSGDHALAAVDHATLTKTEGLKEECHAKREAF
jgi:C4-dicarboxylate transporter DctM subunit